MGGTFDPVHHGHLFLALEAAFALNLNKVILIPNRVPPHKKLPSTGADHRWEMLKLSIENEPKLMASRLELDRLEGPSYTIDTVSELAREFLITLICGADAFEAKWHRLDDILAGLERLVLVNRPGAVEGIPRILLEQEQSLRSKIVWLKFPSIAISSSDIRYRVGKGKPIRYLVPENVHKYITDNTLYAQ